MDGNPFTTVCAPLKNIYGASAAPILAELGNRYTAEIGIRPRHWVLRLYSNGAVVPVPTQVTPDLMPDVRVRQLFKQAVDKMSALEMHAASEADRFLLNHTSKQLLELCSLQAA